MTRSAPRVLALLALLLMIAAPVVRADVFRPAYLELRELDPEHYAVLWKVPALDDTRRLAMEVQLPPGTVDLEPRRGYFVAGVQVERWRIERRGGLDGQPIEIGGLAAGVSDVIARVERRDGSAQVERLAPGRLAFTVVPPRTLAQTARAYLVLGLEHILGGVDHLLFVLALLLIVRGGRHIVATVTAFTLAHSLTLTAATLGWVHVPGPPVEATIALSIVFVAAEVVHGLRGKTGLTARAPWVVAFCFGLLHGLGFAGALAEVGLPPKAIPLALLTFNVGVELGQLLFVSGVLLLIALMRRLAWSPPRWTGYAVPYAIGGVAMFWVIERIWAYWGR